MKCEYMYIFKHGALKIVFKTSGLPVPCKKLGNVLQYFLVLNCGI